MIEFLELFGEIFLYPLNPEYLDLSNNPLYAVMIAVLLGCGLVYLVRRLFRCIFSFF